MKEITKVYTVYPFDELSDDAKEKVIQWYSSDIHYEWWDFVYDDFETVAKIMGIQVGEIYFSGFWSQGDGATFEGDYSYEKGSLQAIKEYAPQDAELHRIAKELQQVQKKYFYSLVANIKHSGHYYHSLCNIITIDDGWNFTTYQEITEDTEETIKQLLRDLMDWLYERLENEYNYLTSEENVKDSCEANEWFFTADGVID